MFKQVLKQVLKCLARIVLLVFSIGGLTTLIAHYSNPSYYDIKDLITKQVLIFAWIYGIGCFFFFVLSFLSFKSRNKEGDKIRQLKFHW